MIYRSDDSLIFGKDLFSVTIHKVKIGVWKGKISKEDFGE